MGWCSAATFDPVKMAASVLIADNPTGGLDVGAIQYVHARLLELSQAGGAILLITLDLDNSSSWPIGCSCSTGDGRSSRAMLPTSTPKRWVWRWRVGRLGVRAWSGATCGQSVDLAA